MRNVRGKCFVDLIIVLSCVLAGFIAHANAQARKVQTSITSNTAVQQPLYDEYRGVRLGMTAAEARAALGTPALKESDQDYYIFSETETAQIAYDKAGRVVTISVDYLGGVGAPDYKAVVGTELEQTATGNLYRLVRYPGQRFWVSYNKSSRPVIMVSVTIQKF